MDKLLNRRLALGALYARRWRLSGAGDGNRTRVLNLGS